LAQQVLLDVYVAKWGWTRFKAWTPKGWIIPGAFGLNVLPNPDLGHREVGPHGITQARDGHVYTADIDESMIGELDPETGKVLTTKRRREYAAHDSFGLQGQRLVFRDAGQEQNRQADAVTKKITEYEPLADDAMHTTTA